MSDTRTRYVGFNGRQVAISSDHPAILAGVDRCFRWMLQAPAPAAKPVARLEAGAGGKGFFLHCDLASVQKRFECHSFERILSYVNDEVVLGLMHSRPDLIWLHASVAALDNRALLISAASGCGKSTLVASLCELGWRFLSDDIAPLDPQSGKVFPFPQTPFFRVHPGMEMAPQELRELRKEEAKVRVEQVSREPATVAAIVLPAYAARQPDVLAPCSPSSATLELLKNCLNFADHGETAFHRLCELVTTLPTFRVSFASGRGAAQLLRTLSAPGLSVHQSR
jgi:hypothetical protein